MTQTNRIWAIIPAAGMGQRMNAGMAKQYLTLHNLTVLEHTTQTVLDNDNIQHVVICVNEQDNVWSTLPLESNQRVTKVIGGATRAYSVLNGLHALAELADADDWVLVHDAARPCLSKQSLSKLIDELVDDAVGGLLAVPVKDTLKQISLAANGDSLRIEKTIDRRCIWQAQTPQMFRYALLKKALSSALEASVSITDEASAIEYAGYQPKLVEGDQTNLKITTPDDLSIAEILLKP